MTDFSFIDFAEVSRWVFIAAYVFVMAVRSIELLVEGGLRALITRIWGDVFLMPAFAPMVIHRLFQRWEDKNFSGRLFDVIGEIALVEDDNDKIEKVLFHTFGFDVFDQVAILKGEKIVSSPIQHFKLEILEYVVRKQPWGIPLLVR